MKHTSTLNPQNKVLQKYFTKPMDANPSPTHTQYVAHVHFVKCPNIGIRILGEITESRTVLLEKQDSPPFMEHESSLQLTTTSYPAPTQCVYTPTSSHSHLGPDKTISAAVSLRYINAT